jgi:hypothetical protein
MSTITRMWLGFAALSAGIIHAALVVSSPLPVAILLGMFGLAEVAWGLVTFVRPKIVAARIVLLGALAPTVLWGVLVAVATIGNRPAIASYLGFSAMLFATVLGLFVSVVLAIHLRRGTDFTQPTRETTAPRYLFGVLVGGVLAAMIVTPALSATDAGKYARPMTEMTGMNLGLTSLAIHSHK